MGLRETLYRRMVCTDTFLPPDVRDEPPLPLLPLLPDDQPEGIPVSEPAPQAHNPSPAPPAASPAAPPAAPPAPRPPQESVREKALYEAVGIVMSMYGTTNPGLVTPLTERVEAVIRVANWLLDSHAAGP